MRYFPTPYPDELLGSLLIRACHHLGLPPRALVRLLADGSSDLVFLYPSFLRGLSHLTNLSPEDLLLNHTVFPYAAIGLPTTKRLVLERELLMSTARGNSVRLRAAFGLHIENLSRRRFCKKCCVEEYSQIGESYWHRRHALPGIFVCPQHGEPLCISSVSVLPKLSTGNAKLPQEVVGNPVDWGLDMDGMQRLAAAVLEATELPAETWDHVTEEYKRLTACFDFEHHRQRRWGIDPMVLEFSRFYDERFLQKTGLALSSIGSDSWPARLVRGARPAMLLQLRHVLLRLFLKF
ncbi:TnsD family transposase [Paraburkholderia sp. USG1]|uniref:TniQ family protein n=1 Tax=Paraburkholderia sp. USG1 TaxID=2952268 RepID=UPI002861B89E|nr:TniQ family protein [Paraburkholderia sp. USG1]MDR8401862.1 TnsD family transposase [Paraburkholderia sp. USG1]